MPDYVVTPESVEEIQRILRFANREEIPVIPYVSGANIGGLTIPEEGDIILDLKRLNRITKIGTETHYAIIEPGVDPRSILSNPPLRGEYPKTARPPTTSFGRDLVLWRTANSCRDTPSRMKVLARQNW